MNSVIASTNHDDPLLSGLSHDVAVMMCYDGFNLMAIHNQSSNSQDGYESGFLFAAV